MGIASECNYLFSLKKYVNDVDVMKLAIKHDHKLFYHSNSITDIEILNYVVEKTEDFAFLKTIILFLALVNATYKIFISSSKLKAFSLASAFS